MRMSTNWAHKYAIMEARTAKGDKENTWEKVSSPIGDEGIAGIKSASSKIPMEKNEAKIPRYLDSEDLEKFKNY